MPLLQIHHFKVNGLGLCQFVMIMQAVVQVVAANYCSGPASPIASASHLERIPRHVMPFIVYLFPLPTSSSRVIQWLGMHLSRVTTLAQSSVTPLPSRTELAIPRTLSLSGWHSWPWQPTNVSSWPGSTTLPVAAYPFPPPVQVSCEQCRSLTLRRLGISARVA